MGNQKRGFRVLLDGSHLQAAPRRAKCCAGRGANGKVASDRINTSLTSTTASFSTGSAEREGSDRAELGRADEAVEPRSRRKRAVVLTAVRQATAIERHPRGVDYANRAVLQPRASLGLLRRVPPRLIDAAWWCCAGATDVFAESRRQQSHRVRLRAEPMQNRPGVGRQADISADEKAQCTRKESNLQPTD